MINLILFDHKKFPHIPKQFITYFENNHKEYQQKITDWDVALYQLNNLFFITSKITNLSPQDVIDRTDINLEQFTSEKLESAFAELRTIIYLDDCGFSDIKPLKSENTTEADLMACHDGVKFAIEVRCFVDEIKEEEYMKIEWKKREIEEVIKNRFKQKKKQLIRTGEKYNCEKKMLCLVINTPSRVALNDQKDFKSILESVYKVEGYPPDTHFAIITGRKNIHGVIDDVIYPTT